MEIIRKDHILNNHSKTDGCGTLRASIPGDICRRIMAIEEFDWVLNTTDNNALELFCKLNPQFDIRYRPMVTKFPDFITNKDGSIWDLRTLRPVTRQKSKWNGL